MKKILLLVVLAVSSVAVFAQGTVNFATAGAGVNAPLTNGATGLRVALADNVWAAVYVGAPGAPGDSLTNGAAGSALQVGGTSPGYVLGGSRAIGGAAGGSTITFQIRAWFQNAGATYEEARGAGSSLSGPGYWASNPVQVTLASGLSTPPNPAGLIGGTIVPIPEPSAIALGLLGLGAVALFRRRK